MYQRIDKTPPLQLSKQSDIVACPSKLVSKFGPPTEERWDRESLGGFYFMGPTQEVFTVYVRAYDAGWWTMWKLRRTFWSSVGPVEFSLGSMPGYDVAGFQRWLTSELANTQNRAAL